MSRSAAPLGPVMSRGQLLTLTLAAFSVAVAGLLFCIVQIYRTAQLPEADASGMQWIILTPLSILFLFIVMPAFVTGLRGLRLLRTSERVELRRALPGRGWLIALGVLVLYFLTPFILAPLLGLFIGE